VVAGTGDMQRRARRPASTTLSVIGEAAMPRVKLNTGGKVLLWTMQLYLVALLALIFVRFLKLF
jgi:hypothetical protein